MEIPRVAVLVDADNVSGEQIGFVVAGAAECGRLVLRRAFGRLAAIAGKVETLTEHGFAAEVALPLRSNGKNAADLMLAQYATRLAERRSVEIIALVSTDGDFAPVATGLAEAGIRTIGFGRRETPAAFRDACLRFVPFPETAPAAPGVPRKPSAENDRKLLTAIVNGEMRDGRVHLSIIGKRLTAEFGTDYKSRFGGRKVSDIVAELGGFTIEGSGPNKEWVVSTSMAGG